MHYFVLSQQDADINEDQSRSLQSSRCGCSSCSSAVLGRDAEGHPVGARIDWLKNHQGMSEQQACQNVCGEEFPGVCGNECKPDVCNSGGGGGGSRCGCSSCSSAILGRDAQGHPVGARIDWLKNTQGMSEQQACQNVCGEEFPGVCGNECKPGVCNSGGGGGGGGSGTCKDNPSDWHDSDGSPFNCAWYSKGNNCQKYGNGFANRGKTANQACCACGGGSSGTAPTPTPPPPTGGNGRAVTPFNEGLNSNIRSRGMLPYLFDNKSRYNDNEIYIAVVGIVNGQSVWIDLSTSNFSPKPRSTNYNTRQGPSHDTSGFRYANIFTRLSDISSNTVGIPRIAGCKMFVSFKRPLYLNFKADGGYSQPDLNASGDPNRGIRFETMELTWAPNGLWINTSRVDAYQYPMGLEVYGNGVGGGNNYKKIGEVKDHNAILNLWPSRVSNAFRPCYVTRFYSDGDGIIKQPSKISHFQPGGASGNYFQAYINQIWSTFRGSRKLKASFGDIGIWEGQVASNNVLTMRCVSNCPNGAVPGRVNGIPNTQEAIEAKGKLAQGATWDLNVQKMIAAAINRRVIDVNQFGTQNWGDNSKYYQANPNNQYAKFFHNEDISYNSETYAFSYDDVFEQSSTIQANRPDKTRITIGGFYNVQGH